jgi:hypothetical protein
MTSARKSVAIGLFLAVLLLITQPAAAIPAFARKYGLPCSACHIGWPILNAFGQSFRDNGYQLMNERDSPIYQNPSYFPLTFRVTPNWHRESASRQAMDVVPGTPTSGQVEQTVTTHGFDLSGVDIWTAGTLYKNISFSLLPSMAEGDTFHLENAFVRFDNLLGSRWLNLKFGKFELDTLLSEKRFLTLSSVGGTWYNYHFEPPYETLNLFGIGDNQLGIELMGHSKNSYARYSVSLLSSNNGNPGFVTNTSQPQGRTYDLYVHGNEGFQIRGLGLQRVGAFGYFGMAPTYFLTGTVNGTPGTPVVGIGNRSFSRVGAYGWWFIKDLDVETFYMHGQDNVFLGNNTPANQPFNLPLGAAGPSWNGGFVEAHYAYNPQLIFTGRYELIRMSRQANPTIPDSLGNLSTWTIGYRWYPIMFSRAGLAFHGEYGRLLTSKTSMLTGRDQESSSVLIGWDFDF